MASLFWRQFRALYVKNLITFRVHWVANLLRCLIFPLGYGLFLAYCETFFSTPSNGGLGNATLLARFEEAYDGSRPLVWLDETDGSGFLKAKDIMAHVASNFTQKQLQGVKQVQSSKELASLCVMNIGGASFCYATVIFIDIPSASLKDTRPLNYTFLSDRGIWTTDVHRQKGPLATNFLPLQWTIDQAIINLSTGQTTPWPKSQPWHNIEGVSADSKRQQFLLLIEFFIAFAFYLAMAGIPYQIAGGVALERANLLTSYMQCMGALDSARILSWHLSVSSLYLPVWIVLGVVWKLKLFIHAPIGLLIGVCVIQGLALASWAFFVSVPFKKNPQLAAVVTTVLAMAGAIIPIVTSSDNGSSIQQAAGTDVTPAILTFFFPSMFIVYVLKSLVGFDLQQVPTVPSQPDPAYGYVIVLILIPAVVSIIVWPVVAIWCERWLYGISNPSNKRFFSKKAGFLPPGVALSLRNVRKVFRGPLFKKSGRVVAIDDLSLDVPSHGIFVLLGPNGAGKSTALSILSGLTTATSGEIVFEGNISRPALGDLGVVPQQNVLFAELSCLQNLRVWNAIKAPSYRYELEDLEQLIRDCDLQTKMHELAGTLSGGQKRKLQLAIGLVGGSKIILVDECTSGVDPLSRRALWKTLTTYRNDRTIILTTHFLDEADFLADEIAVLAAPGRLIACDTPVALKSNKGDGYSITVKFTSSQYRGRLLQEIQHFLPQTTLTTTDSSDSTYHLKTGETAVIALVLRRVEELKSQLAIASYEISGATIENIFLDLLQEEEDRAHTKEHVQLHHPNPNAPSSLMLSNGRPRSPFAQALTIFHKRVLMLRRSWIIPLLTLLVGITGGSWPIRFIDRDGVSSCIVPQLQENLALPSFPLNMNNESIWIAPPTLEASFNATLPEAFYSWRPLSYANPFKPMQDQAAVTKVIQSNFSDFMHSGAIVLDYEKDEYLLAWDASTERRPLQIFNVASNELYARAWNSTKNPASGSRRIVSSSGMLPRLLTEATITLVWVLFFGAGMVVFPAFFTLYVAKERHTSVYAMQLSNGLSNPLGLWLGHLLFDSMFVVIISTFVAIYLSVERSKFQGVGLLWFVITLYGIVSTLLAYIVAIVVNSPLGAFGVMVVTQFVIFAMYMVGIIVTLTSSYPAAMPRVLNLLFYGMGFASPAVSLGRAGIVSINQFGNLCQGEKLASGRQLASMSRFGGPIVYLVVWAALLLFILSQLDTGVRLRSRASNRVTSQISGREQMPKDILAEALHAAAPTNRDPLRILNVSKTYGKSEVVDNVSFTVPKNSLFAMLGPNGAGKTTTLDIIRGQTSQDKGDVTVNNISVTLNTMRARGAFGVCPQFTALDSNLTVREHLLIYGRLKGIPRGSELRANIDLLMAATGLNTYANRVATKLSGGNQRKLALAIALIGNPPVVLVDEYSTGIDAKMKRELWALLKQLTKNKSVLLTTHSMEEASYLATKVGIMNRRMLAIGTPHELESRNASYEVHFSCRSAYDAERVQAAMNRIPGARRADDVSTRFEVPIAAGGYGANGVQSVAELFERLSVEKDFPEFMVGKSTLETAFMRIINENNEREQLSSNDEKWA